MELVTSINSISDFNGVKSEKMNESEKGLTETNGTSDNLNSEVKIQINDVDHNTKKQEEKALDLITKENPSQEPQQQAKDPNPSTETSQNLLETQNKSENLAKKEFKCIDCNEIFTLSIELKKHKRIIHGICICNICLKRVAKLKSFKNHKGKKHNISHIFTCKYCNEVFFSNKEIFKHMKTHKNISMVNNFKKTFKTKVEISDQECIIGKKLFQCEVCRKCFSGETNLNTHKNKYHLKNHKNKQEIYNKCGISQKSYKKSNKLMLHKRLHEKLYQCNTCNKAFSKKVHLMAHQLNHSGV